MPAKRDVREFHIGAETIAEVSGQSYVPRLKKKRKKKPVSLRCNSVFEGIGRSTHNSVLGCLDSF